MLAYLEKPNAFLTVLKSNRAAKVDVRAGEEEGDETKKDGENGGDGDGDGPFAGALDDESPKNYDSKKKRETVWSRKGCCSYGFAPHFACAKL